MISFFLLIPFVLVKTEVCFSSNCLVTCKRSTARQTWCGNSRSGLAAVAGRERANQGYVGKEGVLRVGPQATRGEGRCGEREEHKLPRG